LRSPRSALEQPQGDPAGRRHGLDLLVEEALEARPTRARLQRDAVKTVHFWHLHPPLRCARRTGLRKPVRSSRIEQFGVVSPPKPRLPAPCPRSGEWPCVGSGRRSCCLPATSCPSPPPRQSGPLSAAWARRWVPVQRSVPVRRWVAARWWFGRAGGTGRNRRRAGVALAQPAVGAHGGPMRVLAQGILLQQPQRGGQGGRVLTERLPRRHQPGQRVAIEALQPIALAQHPVVVEAIQEVAAVQRNGFLQRGDGRF